MCDVLIDKDCIVQVGEHIEPDEVTEVIDAQGKYLLPGLVDMHVHFRDPGFEYKETIETGTRAAVHGGFTDVATMPNTSPVIDNGAEIRYEYERARDADMCHVRPLERLHMAKKARLLLKSAIWLWKVHAPSQTMDMVFRVPV